MVQWVSLFVIAFFASLLIDFILRWKNGWKYIRKFPGPVPLPFIGNALSVAGSRTRVMAKGFEWKEKYGSTFRFWMKEKPVIVTSDRALVKKICSSQAHVNKAKQYERVKQMVGTNALVISAAHIWRIDKKKFLPAFQKDGLELAIVTTNAEGRKLVKTLSGMKSQDVDILDVVCDTIMNILIRTMMELRHEDLVKFSTRLMDIINRSKYLASVVVFQQWFANPILWRLFGFNKMEIQVKKDMIDLVTEFDAIIKFNESQKTPEELGGPKVIERSLAAIFFDPNEPLEWRCNQILSNCLAGMDTTGISVSWTLFYLAINPDIMARVQEEIDLVLGDLDEDCDITHEHLADLKYLEMCWKEAMRLQPSGSLIGRNLGEDVTDDDGRVIPSGTDVLIHIIGVHRDPNNFQDPLAYKPDRFNEELKPHSYMPFSSGPRSCIGQKVGSTEARTLLAHILRKFTVTTNQKEQDFGLIIEVATIPSPSILLQFEPRVINNNE